MYHQSVNLAVASTESTTNAHTACDQSTQRRNRFLKCNIFALLKTRTINSSIQSMYYIFKKKIGYKMTCLDLDEKHNENG